MRKSRNKRKRLKEVIKHDVLKTNDSAHRIALGAAIGFFVAWIPLPGVLMLTTAFLAFIFRANIAVAVAAVWINNPITIFPMYYGGYLLGDQIGKTLNFWQTSDKAAGQQLFDRLYSFNDLIISLAHPKQREQLVLWMFEMGKELWLGCVLAGLMTGFAGYVLAFLAIRHYRAGT